MITVTFDALKNFIGELGYDPKIQNETGQIYIILTIEKKEFPLFVRIYEQNDLIQLLTFMPMQITPGTHADLARLLHLVNKELDIPGFGMDENAGVAFYRLMIPIVDNKVSKTILQSYLKAMEMVCHSVTPPILAVATGSATYADIINETKKMEQNRG